MVCLLALAMAFTSCKSIHQSAIRNEIKAEKMVFNTLLDRSDYQIIGTAIGESDFVGDYDDALEAYVGDTGQYGYIYESEDSFIGQSDNGTKMYVGTGKTPAYTSDTAALRIAKLNANYKLIEDAYKQGGDSIFEPTYTFQTKRDNDKFQYKVSVRAKIIKIKNN